MTLHVSQRSFSCRAVFDRFDSGLAKAASESKTIGVRVGAQWFEAQAAEHQSELRELFDKFQCKQLGRTADGYMIFEQLPVTACGAGGGASSRQGASGSAGAGGSGTGSSSAPTGPGTPSPGGSTSGAAPFLHQHAVAAGAFQRPGAASAASLRDVQQPAVRNAPVGRSAFSTGA